MAFAVYPGMRFILNVQGKEFRMRRMLYVLLAAILACSTPVLLAGCAGGKKAAQEAEARRMAEEEARKAEEARMQAEEKARQEAEAKKAAEARRAAKAREMAEETARKERMATLEQDINFDFDKFDIRPDAAAILQSHAAVLKEFGSVKVTIEGHCDDRGTIKYNLALGERRANSAKRYLEDLGVASERMTTVSYGEERPLDPRQNKEAWAKNRRCTFIK